MKKILFIFLLLPSICFGQVVKTGVVVQNGGTQQGRATTVNCDGTTMTCAMSGSTVTLTSSGGGSSSGASFSSSASQGTIGFLDVQGTLNLIGGNGGLIYTGAGSTAGNVGIGSTHPGQALDVQGTIRDIGEVVGASGIKNSGGYTQSGTATNTFPGTMTMAGGAATIANTSGNFYTTGSGQVGGGTSCAGEFCVYNGGMTIGATTGTPPSEGLGVTGNVGVGTVGAPNTLYVAGSAIIQGNVGIGTGTPGQILDVQGTIRTTSLTVSGANGITDQGSMSANNYTSTGSTPPANGFTQLSANKVVFYTNTTSALTIDANQNVGIGTTTPQGGLTVTNGNVGIGTWTPIAPLSIGANAFTVNSAGSITALTGITTTGAYTQSGTGINYFTGNVGIGSNAPNSSLDVEGTLSTATFGGNVGVGTFSPQYKLIVAGAGNVGIGTSNVSGALISIGGACATEENIGLCIGKGSTGIACVGYCTGSLGTCSACTCC